MLHNKKFMQHGSFLCMIKSCNFVAINKIFNMSRNRFLLFLVVIMTTSLCIGKNHKEVCATSRQFMNPVIWADVPDPDVIRVGDYFYMVTTTMHLMPGAPIMRSKDLVNWETVNYIFDKLTDSPKYDMKAGTVYGRGQWATSLKYHNGKFYALFAPNDNPGGDTYIYTAKNPTDKWELVSRMRHFHDATLFFDDDNRTYVVYGTGQMCELTSDLKGVKEGSDVKLFNREADETGLLEGSRMIKHNGKYYLLMISWPMGKARHQVCYRSDNIHGPFEKKTILETPFGGFSYVGQGTIVDAKNGKWYGIIFQDRGGVGRVLTLEPCNWINGWPILGDEKGHVPEVMDKPIQGCKSTDIVGSDDFNGNKLKMYWQWNHNPIDSAWSLTERKGYLRLKTSRISRSIFDAPNTISQRMKGPKSSAVVSLDISKMKDGDETGFAAFNGDSGILTISKTGKKHILTMSEESVSLSEREKAVTEVKKEVKDSVEIKSNKIYLRIDADFNPGKDIAKFYYSLDNKNWNRIGSDYKMIFDYRRFFMGTRFAIFNYATKQAGGYVDIDFFKFSLIK
jgi:beta-xylosidase